MQKKMFVGYHGTDKSHYDNLEKKRTYSPKQTPSDLGNGLYFFIDRVDKLGEAIKNAKQYLKRWKPDYKNKIISQMELEFNQDKLLDLDDLDNQNAFNLFIEENEETINNELKKLVKNNTKMRGNFDGLVIELMIKEFSIDVSAVIKETYTQFDMNKQRKRSNIPNGKELCLREYNCIKKKSIYEEIVVK